MHIKIVDDQKLKDVKNLFSNTERQAPVEVDGTYEVSIEDLAREGDGIARVEGFVIFVPDTKVGDNVEIRVTKVMRKFAFGEKVE